MDFTVLIVALMISFGIPLRNKAIKEYRQKKEHQTKTESPNGGSIFLFARHGRALTGASPEHA